MSQAAKIAVPLLLLAAVAGGAAWYLTQANGAAPPSPVAPAEPSRPVPSPTVEPAVPAPLPDPSPDPVRNVAPSTGNAHADASQGVRGRVLLPNGAPAADVPVLLLESAMNDPLKLYLANRTGRISPPLATTTTAADGTFALGVRQPGKPVDLRVVSMEHVEINRPQLRVAEGDWYEIDLTLEFGVVVQGRVVELGSMRPVAEAQVFLASSHQSYSMIAAPGRERGVPTTTDRYGVFRFANAPRSGLINLVAEAPGYANGQLLNQPLKVDVVNEFTLELEPGQPISGIVVDTDGKPLPRITLQATGLSAKTPQNATTESEVDGTFVFPSLRHGPYMLTASSPYHAEVKLPTVLTGESDVKVVMSTRGTIKLRVLAANKSPVKSYRISLNRFFPNNPQAIARVLDFADRNINPGDYPRDFGGDWAAIRGVPAGEFRLIVTENNHAKTMSPPFQVAEGAAPVEVVVDLTLGGTITGVVLDDRNQPIADALVTTDMNSGLAADLGLLDVFRTMMPERHTKASARTNAQGRFRISRLAFAEYMVRAAHPSYCEGSATSLVVENEGQEVDAGVIQLASGAVVEGLATIGGEPAGQVKITLSTPLDQFAGAQPGQPAGGQQQPPPRVLFNATAISDGEGRFRLLKRVPPGNYRVTASRPSSGGAESPFGTLIDMRETAQELRIAPGQQTVQINFNLPRR